MAEYRGEPRVRGFGEEYVTVATVSEWMLQQPILPLQ